MNTKIFKAYDVRGIYPDELDERAAYSIGRAAAVYLKAKNIAVGRDTRPSSNVLFTALCKGISEGGSNVLDLGPAQTPLVYFTSRQSGVDGSVTITASHNPVNWNGFKITKSDAIPIGEDTGLKDIQALAEKGEWKRLLIHGMNIPTDVRGRYEDRIASFWDLGDKKYKVVIDAANAMGILELPIYKKSGGKVSFSTINCDPDHPFECHEANPQKTETLEELRKKVTEEGADLGIAYDGDADRIGFVDETGAAVPMDLITGLISAPVLVKYPKAVIYYDLRSSMSVKEEIEKNGGIAKECMVGHAKIKKQMRGDTAAMAGELSGHYYFRENSFAEMSTLAAIFLMNHMAKTGKKLSELIAEIKKYHHSGEVNSTVADAPGIMAKLKEKYKDGALIEIDGIKISYPDPSGGTLWWFNVRSSNTEPLLRLNVEAKTKEMMEEKRAELLSVINGAPTAQAAQA
ncbi:MAG: phosphomannomutase/phosphoglucomutase [Candidatus Paceibacterota bacterium]|jgi:phosphomannomutase|nr:phosphomannomutase/phosphoglucomutase [Candidatus Paceibacterota bacterium]